MKLVSPALVLSLSFGVASAARLQASSSREKLSIVLNGPAARSSTRHELPHDAHPLDAGRFLKEETSGATAVDDGAVIGTCGQCEKTTECAVGHLCIIAAASGCFNFDVSDDTNSYCRPFYVPGDAASTSATTDGPTVIIDVVDAGTTAAPTSTDAATTSEPTSSPSVGGTTVEPTATPTVASGVGRCGQCKKADDCLPGYDCVGANESGCFNFVASGDKNLYCVPASTTDGPTVAATDDATATPTIAGTTVEPTTTPTIAGTTVEPTTTPTVAGTTIEPTAAPTVAGTDGATTLEPTRPPSYATIRWIGGDPSITLQACEGDCDDGKFNFYVIVHVYHYTPAYFIFDKYVFTNFIRSSVAVFLTCACRR